LLASANPSCWVFTPEPQTDSYIEAPPVSEEDQEALRGHGVLRGVGGWHG